MRVVCAVVLAALLTSIPSHAQPPAAALGCPMPQASSAPREASLFTPEQAVQLADIVSRSRRAAVDTVGDAALVGYLQAMADRMIAAAAAPPARVAIVDVPEINAWTVPGRIYVARKLIAFAESEDELAGVLAHEIGHGLAGDFERDMSAVFRKVINVTALGDARDIEDKYHRVLDAVLEGKRVDWSGDENAEQENADRVAVWLMTRAGYSAQAYERIWDRLAELRSNAGSWLTDLFGLTSPNAKRLRVTRAAAIALPAACLGTRATTEKPFADWRAAVLAASRTTTGASPRGVRTERKLNPELRSAVSFLKFSPDGRHVLAQDDGSVYLFSREGLKFTHRIEAPDAHRAQFSPDSAAVVFYDRNYRVERWSVATGTREWTRDVVTTKPCAQSELSPDGAHLVCVTAALEVRVYDVATGSTVFAKEFFITDQAVAGIVIGASPGDDQGFELLKTRFSPDGRYLVLARNMVAMGIDLTTRATISLPGSLRERLGLSFAFLPDGRIIGLHVSNPADSGIVTFPDGKVVAKINLGRHALAAPAHGDRYILVGQLAEYAVGLLDLTDGKLKGGTKTPAFDVFDDHYVAELRNGEVAVYRMDSEKPVSFAAIPPGPLGWLRSVSVDADFTTLAASQNTRGAAWDLATGKGLLTRPFRGSHVDGTLAYLDFPSEKGTERAVVRIEPSTQGAQVLASIQEPPLRGATPPRPVQAISRVSSQEFQEVSLAGTFLVANKMPSGSQPPTVAVLEAATGRVVWTRTQPKSRAAAVLADGRQGTVSLAWPFGQAEAKAILEANPELARRAEAQSARKSDLFVLEVRDLSAGTARAHYVTTVKSAATFLTDRHLSVSLDRLDRTLVHDLSTGDLVGRAFGRYRDVHAASGLVVMTTGRRELTVASLPKLEPVSSHTFPHDVAFARLGADGKRLLVVTTGQSVYTLDVGSK